MALYMLRPKNYQPGIVFAVVADSPEQAREKALNHWLCSVSSAGDGPGSFIDAYAIEECEDGATMIQVGKE